MNTKELGISADAGRWRGGAFRTPPRTTLVLLPNHSRRVGTSGSLASGQSSGQMSASYYREQTNFYPPTIPHSAPNVVHAADNSTVARPDDHSHPGRPAQVSSPATSQVGPPRYCTVKGCTVILLPDYLHKMCEACRGRHRVYAMTKRAKRKAEKAALGMQGGQPVVWMPQDDENDDEGDAREGSPTSQHEEDLRPTDVSKAGFSSFDL